MKKGGQFMSMSILSSTPRATTIQHGFIPDEIRAFIAEYIGVDAEHLNDATHFEDDLGLDKLDRLELLILIEELTGTEFTDDEFDQMDAVGDVTRYIVSGDHERAAAMLLSRKLGKQEQRGSRGPVRVDAVEKGDFCD